jgi:hypothetical protein
MVVHLLFDLSKVAIHFKIISRGTKRGIPTPYYVGNWIVAKGVTIELHKF